MTMPCKSSPGKSSLGKALLTLMLGAVLATGGCGSHQAGSAEQPPLAGAAIGGQFTLVDKTGKTVRWTDMTGHYRIVYFGYTFCPDACPTDMMVAMRGLDIYARQHPQKAANIVPLFISIDPARDTPQVVGEFAAHFSPRLVGLTGSPQQVEQAAKAFAAYYARGKETSGGYLMDHSRIAYLMAPNGDPITMLPVDKGAEAVAADLDKWVK